MVYLITFFFSGQKDALCKAVWTGIPKACGNLTKCSNQSPVKWLADICRRRRRRKRKREVRKRKKRKRKKNRKNGNYQETVVQSNKAMICANSNYCICKTMCV